MNLRELLSELEGWDLDTEVVVQTRCDTARFDDELPEADTDIDDLDGLLWNITDSRSFLLENGKINIIADLPEY